MTLEGVDAMLARVKTMHDQRIVAGEFESPRLGVVAAWRPARKFEYLFDHGHCARAHKVPILRRAMDSAMRCSGLRHPHGRQVVTILFLYASKCNPCGAASTGPRSSKIFNACVPATPAHSAHAMEVDGPRCAFRSIAAGATRKLPCSPSG